MLSTMPVKAVDQSAWQGVRRVPPAPSAASSSGTIEHDRRVGAHWVDDAGFHSLTSEQFDELTRFRWWPVLTVMTCGAILGATLAAFATAVL